MRSSAATRTRTRFFFGTLAILGLLAGGAVAMPSAAEAATSSTCPSGSLCLYFNSNFAGARADLRKTDAALNNELFNDGRSGANGWNVQVGNNSASVWNRTGRDVWLFNGGSCFGDRYLRLAPGAKLNLDASGVRTIKNATSGPLSDSGYSSAALQYGVKNAISSMWVDDGTTTISCKTNVNQSGY